MTNFNLICLLYETIIRIESQKINLKHQFKTINRIGKIIFFFVILSANCLFFSTLAYCENNTTIVADKERIVARDQSVADKDLVKKIMDKVNRYQREHPHAKYDDNWIRGTYYAGVMACYQKTGDKTYLEQCNTLGKQLNWKIPLEKPNARASGANLLTLGQTWIESYIINADKQKIEPLIGQLENLQSKNPISRPSDWYFEGGRHYVDSLFTGPPTLAMLYSVTKNEKYLQWMDAFFWDVHKTLYDKETNLFYRDARFFPNKMKTPDGKKILWSRGNGWAFAGIARILKYLPKDHVSYKRYEQLFREMASALKSCQSSEGFWYPNLADAAQFPVKETSGTAFFVYGFAYGVNNGILEKDIYLPVVEKGWKVLCESVSDEGKLQWGQHVGDRPVFIKQEDSHEYVSGTFLLAASEVYQLSQQSDKAVFQLSDKIQTFLARLKTPIKNVPLEIEKTALSRNDYLNVIERQVKTFRQYRDST
ncbi:MAG: glycoside hydrolase family 88 protein [Planctomycetaceae bacterium]|jgi:rhamnogalacturonyl hydrolase YesR|nr:glycoside hydrolase family 88 protein [Planctomycetaceae bacterium]